VLSQQELNMLLYTAELLGWAYLKIEIWNRNLHSTIKLLNQCQKYKAYLLRDKHDKQTEINLDS
jgi:hypothetical protein